MTRKTVGVTVGLGMLLLWTFMLFNADWLFGPWADTASRTLTIYLLFMAIVLAAGNTELPTLQTHPNQLIWFVVFFVLTWAIMNLLPSVALATIASFETVKVALALGILYGLVKAFAEEVIFRDRLVRMIGPQHKYKVQGLFGLFHAGVLFMQDGITIGAVLLGMLLLTGLGVVWMWVRDNFGLLASTGSHLAYNVMVLTVFAAQVL